MWGEKGHVSRKRMAALRIPRDDLPAFMAITELGEDSFMALEAAIKETPPCINRDKLAAAAMRKLPKFDSEQLSKIFKAMFSLYMVKLQKRIPAAELADLICAALNDVPKRIADFDASKLAILRSRLGSLLSLDDSFGLSVKAANLSAEHEHAFCGARILSDVRPLFVDSPETIAGAVIYHNLQVGFHDSSTGEHKDIYFSLDDEDLGTLKEIVERAQTKSRSLQTLLKSAKVPHIGV